VIFVTYFSTQQGAQPSFAGFGEDGKWYWMVRIANQTSYDHQTILFQEKRATTTTATGTTGTTVDYYRILKNGDKIIANDSISSGQNLNDNSVLGFMMNTGVRISQATSDYFDRVYSSSNNFVFVYKVLYPATTLAKISIDKNKVKYGESVHIDGTVTDTEGTPYKSGVVTLQDSTDGSNWNDVATVTLADGKFGYQYTPPAGNHSLRISWGGVRGTSRPAVSNSVPLYVEPKTVTLALSLSKYNVTLGENVTISMRLSEKLSNGTFAMQYSLDNKTWVDISTAQPQNGTLEYSWRPPKAGALYIQAKYSGSGNFGPATSTVVVLYVKP
jgi:hypothetical protein